MTFIRTLRAPTRGRPSLFVPGSLACAAARPLGLSAAIRWAVPAAPAARTAADEAAAHDTGASSPADDHG